MHVLDPDISHQVRDLQLPDSFSGVFSVAGVTEAPSMGLLMFALFIPFCLLQDALTPTLCRRKLLILYSFPHTLKCITALQMQKPLLR